MGKAIRLKQTSVPRQQDELARLKIIQGPDYGATYIITAPKVVIGRGEDVDVVISDLKASRKHAQFIQNMGGWQVQDLGSANGIMLNGKNTRNAALQSNDTITLGETTLEFMASEQGTMMLVAPPRTMAQIQAEQGAFDARQSKIHGFGQAASQKQGINPKIMLVLVVGAAFFFLMPDEGTKEQKGSRKPSAATEPSNLEQYLPGAGDPANKVAEQFFKSGFREYTAGNFLRARTQFEIVLQMAPGHRLSTLYLQNANKKIENEVKFHLEHGKKSLQALRLRDSRGHYEAILRLLWKDQSNPAYSEAKDQLDKVKMAMDAAGGGPS